MMSLKLADAAPTPCKICGAPAAPYGSVDFNRPCLIRDAVTLPPSGTQVPHLRCGNCGFLFTDAFDAWSHADFKAHIYNDGYITVDPGYLDERPRQNAQSVIDAFGNDRGARRVLDFGGGNDVLCSALRAAGFPVAVTYDPFVPEYAQQPEGLFDLITCFETLEHMPDPLAGIATIVRSLAEPGLVFFTTLVQPDNLDALGLNWWYVGPRNGHVSLFSRQALAHAWGRHGCHVASFTDNIHVAFRALPDFARQCYR